MSPKHISEVPEYIEETKRKKDGSEETVQIPRRAVAPYNFVELPEKVVEAEDLPSGDRYHPDRHTGRIECTLTTESPLYIRCGLTTEEFQAGKEAKDLPAFFYTEPSAKSEKPVIPGSSLRGMLRTLVEIASFSKIERVSDEHRLFFRAVAGNPNKESWAKEYKKYVQPEKIQAGYFKKDSQGSWSIQPAIKNQGVTFAWVQEDELTNIPGFNKFDDYGYGPQYFNVTYQSLEKKEEKRNGQVIAQRWFARNIHLQESESSSKLVTSGNMKQGDESSPRCNHCVVFSENKNAQPLPINEKAIEHYRNALTEFQKKSPFDKSWGVLEENCPVFYCPPKNGNKVGFFGQSPNFRIPYSPEENGRATTVVDFIPEKLKQLATIDLADAIFGWVKQETKDQKLPKGFNKQRAGRIFVTDALYQSTQNGLWYEKEPLTPQILSEPKPSYFPHYLVQPNTDKLELKHYASQPVIETLIRGHKLYWHKGNNPNFKLPQPKKVIDSSKRVKVNVSDTQTTLIKPIKKGVTFKFDIHFENLSDVELGALLWVLNVAKDDAYRLKLGMGKPLGLGAIKIEPTLYLSSRQKRYQNLFDSNDCWETRETDSNKGISDYVSKFETYMLEQLNHTGDFKKLCRIQMLLAMLSWSGITDVETKTRYMEIERDCKKHHHIGQCKPTDKTINEYKERPVLPDPLDIMREVTGVKIECDRPSPSLPKKSAKEPIQQFSEGQEIDAKVVNIKIQEGQKPKTIITYEIEGSDCQAKEEIYKQNVCLDVGDILKVSIVKTQEKSIRKVKRV